MVVAALHALSRSRVTAEQDRVVVVNGYRRRVFDRHAVVAVSLGRGAPWATLDLDDGTSVAAMGIQGSDGDRARGAVRQLRAVLDDPLLGAAAATAPRCPTTPSSSSPGSPGRERAPAGRAGS